MDKKPLIVVLDNNKADRMLLKIAMEDVGLDARVEEHEDGQKLVEFVQGKCSAQVPVFIVLDLDMPQTGGLNVLKHLRDNPDLCQVPVIIFTSHFDEIQKKNALELGALKYLVKSNRLKEYNDIVKYIKKTIETK
jgi:CheY-like chemotaxis protein